MTSFVSLKRKLTLLKRSARPKIQDCQSALDDPSPDANQIPQILESLDVHISLLLFSLEKVKDLDSKLLAESEDEDEVLAVAQENQDLADELEVCLARLKARKGALENKGSVMGPSQRRSSISIGEASEALEGIHLGQNSAKLPKLDIISFSGDIQRWQEFWDMFKSSVHHNSKISDVQKFAYLKAKVTGKAAKAIAGLQQTNENYQVAIDCLIERFGCTQVIVDSHYTALMDLQPAGSSISQLRTTYDEVERHLRSLQSLGQDVNHQYLITLIKSKLSKEVLTRLEEQNDQKEWSVDSLRNQVRKYIVARELSDKTPASKSEMQFNSNRFAKPNYRATSEALVTNESINPPQRQNSRSCVFCQQSHFFDECTKYRTVASRKRQAKGRCHSCLKTGHRLESCPFKRKCVYCESVGMHHRSLCPVKFSQEANGETTAVVQTTAPYVENVLVNQGGQVLLQTASAIVSNSCGSAKIKLKILLDSASQRTYITKSLASQLKLSEKQNNTLSVYTFGSEKCKELKITNSKIKLDLLDGTKRELFVSIVPQITGKIHRAQIDLPNLSLWESLPLSDNIPESTEHCDVDMLIGADYYCEIITGEKIEIKPGLFLLGSRLGWILTGRFGEEDDSSPVVSMLTVTQGGPPQLVQACGWSAIDPSQEALPRIENLWNTELLGIAPPVEKDEIDEKVLQMFESTIYLENSRYMVAWPWKDEVCELPDNYFLALGRLKSLLRKLASDENLLKKYDAIIQDQITKGIVEPVTDSLSNTRLHYIPHHAVITPQKATTKVRIVYDASAKTLKKNKSLNECLNRGPIILGDLCGLLMRFRLNKLGLIADIEKAFLQVGLQENDRNVTRFLWLKNPLKPTVTDNLQIYRFARVPFGVISSPFLLAATVDHHLRKVGSPVGEKIRNNMYVDNAIVGVSTEDEAVKFYQEAKKIFGQASMNLREWSSNSSKFRDAIHECDRVKELKVKVLGLTWDVSDDTLCVPGPHLTTADSTSLLTKRKVLQQLATVFDPLGIFCPVTIVAKIFLQQLWQESKDWDQTLSKDKERKWSSIMNEVQAATTYKLPRYLKQPESQQEYALVCFCDASSQSYCAVVYLKSWNGSEAHTSLMFAKSRLAPVRKLTIPRLELMAMVIGVRCLTFVSDQLGLPVSSKTVWSDSQCALQWFESSQKLPVFVRNRIEELKKHTDIRFRFVPGKENPADCGTRGISAREFSESSIWFSGPHWLRLPINQWPDYKIYQPADGPFPQTEEKIYEVSLLLVDDQPFPFNINPANYSSLMKIFRITAYCLRFINACRKQTKTSNSDMNISVDELKATRRLWDSWAQTSFAEIKEAVKTKAKHPTILQLGLYLDENEILRCNGRLRNSVPLGPKLLPRNHLYTIKIIENAHAQLWHSGVSHTLASVRRQYWIPKGRMQVKKVIKACQICRKVEGGPYAMPPMAPLPPTRVIESPPFTYAGLDYFGPLFVKGENNCHKVWGCIFVCFSTRAIHLEMVADMSADAFLRAFRRFVARRGKPKELLSDNAKQFKLASKVLREVLKEAFETQAVKDYLLKSGIKWNFITELAPWQGGLYERMIGIVKSSLKKVVGKDCMTSDQLATILVEVECIVNSRPLTYLPEEKEEISVLSPSNFLCMNPSTHDFECDLKVIPFKESSSSASELIRSWKKGKMLLEKFWNVWRSDYLTLLRERTQVSIKQGRKRFKSQAKEGDIVLVKDNLPRGRWRLAKIEEVLQGRDGQKRTARIRLGNRKILLRPLNLLYPIEVPPTHETVKEHKDSKASIREEKKDESQNETSEEEF